MTGASRRPRRRVPGILVIYFDRREGQATTVLEHLHSFKRHSRFPVWELNTMDGLPRTIRRLEFDAILFHYTLWPAFAPIWSTFIEYVASCRNTYKAAFFQDEYWRCRARFEWIDRLGIDCVFSCMPDGSREAMYLPHTRATRVEYTLTGYVSDDLVAAGRRWAKPHGERAIDVGYRGRELPFYLGATGREKKVIADEFVRRTRGESLALDISTREEDRIYGDAWPRFLGDCRASLGVESGTTLVDLDGEVVAEYKRLVAENPDLTWEEFEASAAPLLERWEGRLSDLAISPRVFEAAALRSCLIMFEGEYGGVVRPDEHYIPLRKDFSNLDEVLARFRDVGERQAVVERAYEELIASGEFSYRRFVEGVEAVLVDASALPPTPRRSPPLVGLHLEHAARRAAGTSGIAKRVRRGLSGVRRQADRRAIRR